MSLSDRVVIPIHPSHHEPSPTDGTWEHGSFQRSLRLRIHGMDGKEGAEAAAGLTFAWDWRVKVGEKDAKVG